MSLKSPRLQGLEAVKTMFERSSAENRSAFLPYFPVGYPNYDSSLAAIESMSKAGVDGFEIGMPFSDPLADGPTIQAATQVALENGITTKACLEAVRKLRDRGLTQPMLLMGYLNPVLAYGIGDFVRDAKAAGADGFIIPDLPPEEAAELSDICESEGMALVFFLAPTSNTERIRLVARQATGFVYVVSVTGITGARTALPSTLQVFIDRLKKELDLPLVLGFGISTPDHARSLNNMVDGFIVGSALVKAAGHSLRAVSELAHQLRQALNS